MLKLGVVNRRGIRRPRTLLGRRRYVSFLLLRDLANDPAVDTEEYDRLAGHACMPNGVWKLTHQGRLRLLDDAVMSVLRARCTPDAPLVVCDLAASTGATSVDFFRALKASFAVRFVASDLYRDLVVVRSRRWPIAVVFARSGHEVQYVCGPFVSPESPAESAAYPINRAIKAMVRRWFAPAARRALHRVDLSRLGPFQSFEIDDFEVVKLPMLTRDALAALREDEGFAFEEWNIFEQFPIRADVVRAMNILTPEHFSDAQRLVALKNCVAATRRGGLLIVGSCPTAAPTSVQASVYVVDDGRLERVAVLNGGSEIDTLIARTYQIIETTQPIAGAAQAGLRA